MASNTQAKNKLEFALRGQMGQKFSEGRTRRAPCTPPPVRNFKLSEKEESDKITYKGGNTNGRTVEADELVSGKLRFGRYLADDEIKEYQARLSNFNLLAEKNEQDRMDAMAAQTHADVGEMKPVVSAIDEKTDEMLAYQIELKNIVATKEDIERLAHGTVERPEGMTDEEWNQSLTAKIKQLQELKKPYQDQKRQEAKEHKEMKKLESFAAMDEDKRKEAIEKEYEKVQLMAMVTKTNQELTALRKTLDAAKFESDKSPEDNEMKLKVKEAMLPVKQTEVELMNAQNDLLVVRGKPSSAKDENLIQLEAEIQATMDEITSLQNVKKNECERKTAAADAKKAELLASKQAADAALADQKRVQDELDQIEGKNDNQDKKVKKDKKDKKEKKRKGERGEDEAKGSRVRRSPI